MKCNRVRDHAAAKVLEYCAITKQARANTAAQFDHSPTIDPVMFDSIAGAMDSYQVMVRRLLQDKAAMASFRRLLVDRVYAKANESGGQAAR